MAERSLKKLRGNVPVFILRPSIIIASYKEPSPGWIDAMTACAPLTLRVGKGVITKLAKRDNDAFADFIPVDYVSN